MGLMISARKVVQVRFDQFVILEFQINKILVRSPKNLLTPWNINVFWQL